MKEKLEKLLAEAEAEYAKDNAALTKLREEAKAIEAKFRPAKVKAGESGNQVAALKQTLAGMS